MGQTIASERRRIRSGFGLGLEPLVMYVSGMDDIRDAIPCPHDAS